MAGNISTTTQKISTSIAEDVINGIVFTTSIIGVIVNISTILAVSYHPWSAKPKMRLVLSLCVGNLVFLLNYILYRITYYSNPTRSGYESTCLMFEILRCGIYLFVYINIIYLVLDKLIASTNPFGYLSIITVKRTNRAIVCNIVFSILITLLTILFNFLFLQETSEVYTCLSTCSIYPKYKYIHYLNWIYKVSVFICIPVFPIFLVLTVRAVQKISSTVNKDVNNSVKKGIISVYLAVLAQVLCFGPYQVITLHYRNSKSCDSQVTSVRILEQLYYIGAFLIPINQSLLMRKIQEGYRNMFKKWARYCTDPGTGQLIALNPRRA